MPPAPRTASALEPYLRGCGYGKEQLATRFRFADVEVPVAAFACKPWDSWTACIAVVDANGDSKEAAAKVHPLGAPSVFACHADGVDWWAQGRSGPTMSRPIRWQEIGRAFEAHKSELSPSRIYSAKLHKSDAKASQLWFFDAGLMPAVERNRGETLVRLIEQVIGDLHVALGSRLNSRQAQEDVYRTFFWLLAAKVLHDKNVPNFIRIDLKNVDEVFERIGTHHGERGRFPPFGEAGRFAIDAAADRIATYGSLADVSSESLTYVYENALIDKTAGRRTQPGRNKSSDIRKKLGIHSTPSVLINHMLSQLWPLIEDIPQDERHVFEPACGDAPFLRVAMRWLRDWGKGGSSTKTHSYLRTHLHGLETDRFAWELARLSLTLADEPHGNSWRIDVGDMFAPNVLSREAKRARVLLANPPYEDFSPHAKKKLGQSITARSKVVELLNRTFPHLQPGSVFGVVVPQRVLSGDEAASFRKLLVTKFDISEISVFGDNLFSKASAETAILMGRRKKVGSKPVRAWYRTVKKADMKAFHERCSFSSERPLNQDRFKKTTSFDLRVPDLEEVWNYLNHNPTLADVATVGQGLTHLGESLPPGAWTVKPYRNGLGAAGFSEVPENLTIFRLPKPLSINLDKRVIGRPRSGTTTGIAQVLLPYHPVSGHGWRLKAVIDREGHAFKTNWTAVRPKSKSTPLEYLWAVLNSPVANAFVTCFLPKMNILTGTLERLPVPVVDTTGMQRIPPTAHRYLELVEEPERFTLRGYDEAPIGRALASIDAEVLRLYDLPPRLERQLLDFFRGAERKGVGCKFGDYFPAEFRPYIPLHEYISEEYQRSTVGAFLKRHRPIDSPAALAALNAAAEFFAEE